MELSPLAVRVFRDLLETRTGQQLAENRLWRVETSLKPLMQAQAIDTPLGRLPTAGALDLEGLDLADADQDLLLSVDGSVWRQEAALSRDYLASFGDRLPPALWREQEALEARLGPA